MALQVVLTCGPILQPLLALSSTYSCEQLMEFLVTVTVLSARAGELDPYDAYTVIAVEISYHSMMLEARV